MSQNVNGIEIHYVRNTTTGQVDDFKVQVMGPVMIVECRSDKGHELPVNYRGLYYTEQTVFHVAPGQCYEVYEMALFNSDLIILIVDSTGQPSWYPIQLFDVVDGSLPQGWLFAIVAGDASETTAVWGHPRLVKDRTLDEALANHDDNARVVFWNEVAPARKVDG